ncbi:hypothetical protein [Paenibacillus apiarius]|uniref:DUF5668 domain-containing protein n=1 Tax=Paenibacillus apiarius TaxID=46240 RepID=A0ABT4DWH2_9BACL|nr:hypothetical protein [Paenibacillus apiarius]MCY9516854.1 hypothetical protein [Paenibacillus apiarius]MCY9521707.1 hypothetical protein [Paenibacillus apiarius]MCY9554068.1 hypothetical protein [Paenibacillus apiarius]MCY9558873.1 hypothetical protein [Paenibacillus apiarius]MCY9683919.1 hypothetical protein [Paenibacillus apiarius]
MITRRNAEASVFIGLGLLLVLFSWSGWGNLRLSDPGFIFGYFWPILFVIPLGILFHVMHFIFLHRRAPGLLIPGGILLVSGVVCQISMLFDAWEYMWPGFPLAVAFGLFEFYLLGIRNKWLLIPVYILGSMSLLFFAIFSFGVFTSAGAGSGTLALLLIVAGIALLYRRKSSYEY